MKAGTQADAELTQLILARFPYPIAFNYKVMLETEDLGWKMHAANRTFDFLLRTLALTAVSQYLADRGAIRSEALNRLLDQRLRSGATLGVWQDVIVEAVRAYHGQRERFFMTELYDLYEERQSAGAHELSEIEKLMREYIVLRNDIQHSRRIINTSQKRQTAWQETNDLLSRILGKIIFLSNYDFIFLLSSQAGRITYILSEGKSLSQSSMNEKEVGAQLQPGQYYWMNDAARVLPLYPMLVLWKSEPVSFAQEPLGDTAIFDYFTRTNIYYLGVETEGLYKNDAVLADFASLLEKIGRSTSDNQEFSWDNLKAALDRISVWRAEAAATDDDAVSAAESGQEDDIYLQRQEIKGLFESFWGSNKTAFVLVGKSGVGKSSFISSLQAEYRSQTDVAVLRYNGETLDVNVSLLETMTQDIEAHFGMKIYGPAEVKNLLAKINGLPDMASRKVLLWIDAVNESDNPRQLLIGIHQLVNSFDPTRYPWFKIALSSRPEAWRVFQPRQLSHQRYFRPPGQSEPAVELRSFNRSELRAVYEAYRARRGISTRFDDLSQEMRSQLREPILLNFITRTHRNGAIPSVFQPSRVVSQYLNRLDEDGRLDDEDRIFLEGRILPLLFADGEWRMSLTFEEIKAAPINPAQLDLLSLHELINDTSCDKYNRAVNRSFMSLSDVGILEKTGPLDGYQVKFKYDLFYDYYAGRKMAETARQTPDRQAYYKALVKKLDQQPHLWGGIRNALFQETLENGPALIESLCFTDHQRMKEMAAEALIAYGTEYPVPVEQIIADLTSLRRQNRPVSAERAPKTPANRCERNAYKIALETAGRLGILHALTQAARSADAAIRTDTVRHAYRLWLRNRDQGTRLMESIADCVQGSLIPNQKALETLIGISMIIFFEHYEERSVLLQLQAVWRPIIAHLLGVHDDENRLTAFVRKRARELLFSFIVSTIFAIIRGLPDYNVVSLAPLDAFFKLDPDRKNLYRRLVRLIESENPSYHQEEQTDVFAALSERDLLIQEVVVLGMVAHIGRCRQAFLPMLNEILARAMTDPKPSPYVSDIPTAMQAVLDHDPNDDDVFTAYLNAVDATQAYYADPQHIPRLERTNLYRSAQAMFIGPYILYQYRRTEGNVKSDWLASHFHQAVTAGDLQFFEVLFRTELPLVGIEFQEPNAALEALSLLIEILENPQEPEIPGPLRSEIETMTQVFLARMRSFHPDEADQFIETHPFSDEFRLKVRTSEVSETIGDLIGIRLWNFFRDQAIIRPTPLRSIVVRILEEAAWRKNFRQWTDFAVREAINLIYGEEILKQKPRSNGAANARLR